MLYNISPNGRMTDTIKINELKDKIEKEIEQKKEELKTANKKYYEYLNRDDFDTDYCHKLELDVEIKKKEIETMDYINQLISLKNLEF